MWIIEGEVRARGFPPHRAICRDNVIAGSRRMECLPRGTKVLPHAAPAGEPNNFSQILSDWDTVEMLVSGRFCIFGTIWHTAFLLSRSRKMNQNIFEGKLTVSLPEAATAAFGWLPSTTASYLCRGKFPIPFVQINGVKRVRVADLLNFVDGFQPVSRSPKKKPGRPTKAAQLARAGGAA